MRLLVVAASLDLTAPLGVTPATWQLLKALAEAGVELTVAPYQGPPIESPWWTAAENPCQFEGDLVALAKRFVPRPRRDADTGTAPGTIALSDRVTLGMVQRITKPRWEQHLVRLLESEPSTDAVLFLCTPPNHFTGIPALISRRFGVPCFYFDGDVPASLPRFSGFQTGFRIYDGADLSEYAGVFSSSKGGIDDLERLGAQRVGLLYYAADPMILSPLPVEQDIDVFFYGLGREYREHWIDAMLAAPSEALAGVHFAVRGTRLGHLPRVELLPYASFSALKRYCCRSRINLLITRQAHATVYGSSNARPFELAALGCAMVSNPYLGLDEWFEPGKEVIVVHSQQDAIDAYTELLTYPSMRAEFGQRARRRLLSEHTYAHRAKDVLDFVIRGHARRADRLQTESRLRVPA